MTSAQMRALRFAKHQGLRDGEIEQWLHLGLSGAALDAVVRSLERRGYVDGPDAVITVKGMAALDCEEQCK